MPNPEEEGYKLVSIPGRGEFWTRGLNCQINSTVKFKGRVMVDDGTTINEYVELYGGEIFIGKYCSLARNVVFQNLYHDLTLPCTEPRFYTKRWGVDGIRWITKPIHIGNDVWIGTRAIVLAGVTIGDGAIVGAGAIVTKDVEPYSIVAGVPAKFKKWRFPEHIREFLLEIEWWNWDDEMISRNKDFFLTDLNKVEDPRSLIK